MFDSTKNACIPPQEPHKTYKMKNKTSTKIQKEEVMK